MGYRTQPSIYQRATICETTGDTNDVIAMQIVYITNRPGILIETLEHVTGLMGFITEALVVLPNEVGLDTRRIAIPVQRITDEDLLGEKLRSYRHDHQLLNFQLRRAAYSSNYVHEEFIASDDDYRPLKPIMPDFFKSDGKYHCYFFYDLSQWKFGLGDFDRGQQNTYQILKHLGLPHLSYASHMPQIINRTYFRDMLDLVDDYLEHSFCEWSTYFNFCQKRYKSSFHEPSPFRTLTWPDHPLAWPAYTVIPEYCFENFSPRLYEENRPFRGISRVYSEGATSTNTVNKLINWHRYEICLSNPEIPLPKDLRPMLSFSEALTRRLLTPLRKIRKRLAWGESVRLNMIEGQLAQLERQAGEDAGS